jgi:hypothetical protein
MSSRMSRTSITVPSVRPSSHITLAVKATSYSEPSLWTNTSLRCSRMFCGNACSMGHSSSAEGVPSGRVWWMW